MNIAIAIERTDSKRQLLPLKGNTKVTLNSVGDAALSTDFSTMNMKDVDLSESFPITYVSGTSFTVAGDQTVRLAPLTQINIEDSTGNGNDGLYTIVSSSYDSGTALTTVTLEADAGLTDLTADGTAFVYELIWKPAPGEVGRVSGATFLTITDSATAGTGSINLEAGFGNGIFTTGVSHLFSDAQVAANRPIPFASLPTAEVLVTNSAPLYLRRTSAFTGAVVGHLLLEGVSIV